MLCSGWFKKLGNFQMTSPHHQCLFIFRLRGQLHGDFQPWAKISVRPPGWNFVANACARAIGAGKCAGKRFTLTTQAVRMSKFLFQPRLKFECDFMRFFSPFDRTEMCSLVCETGLENSPGLKLSSCNRKRLFKIFFRKPSWNLSPANRGEIRHVTGP